MIGQQLRCAFPSELDIRLVYRYHQGKLHQPLYHVQGDGLPVGVAGRGEEQQPGVSRACMYCFLDGRYIHGEVCPPGDRQHPAAVDLGGDAVHAEGRRAGDHCLARFAQESARQQAEQNREMAKLNREVAQSHQELIGLGRDLEKQQVQVNDQRDLLESERRGIAKQRHRDPIIAAAINSVGVVLACLAPLALAGYLLYCLRDQKEDQLVAEILIQEMVSDEPRLLPAPPAPKAAVAVESKPTPPLIAQADADPDEESPE